MVGWAVRRTKLASRHFRDLRALIDSVTSRRRAEMRRAEIRGAGPTSASRQSAPTRGARARRRAPSQRASSGLSVERRHARDSLSDTGALLAMRPMLALALQCAGRMTARNPLMLADPNSAPSSPWEKLVAWWDEDPDAVEVATELLDALRESPSSNLHARPCAHAIRPPAEPSPELARSTRRWMDHPVRDRNRRRARRRWHRPPRHARRRQRVRIGRRGGRVRRRVRVRAAAGISAPARAEPVAGRGTLILEAGGGGRARRPQVCQVARRMPRRDPGMPRIDQRSRPPNPTRAARARTASAQPSRRPAPAVTSAGER